MPQSNDPMSPDDPQGHFEDLDRDLADLEGKPVADPAPEPILNPQVLDEDEPNRGAGETAPQHEQQGEAPAEVAGHEKGTHPATIAVPARSTKTPATEPDPTDPDDPPQPGTGATEGDEDADQ